MNKKTNPTLYVAFILERFSSPTEHFVLKEISELNKKGIKIEILVLRKQKRYLDLVELKELESDVIYLPYIFYLFPFLIFFICPGLINLSVFKNSAPIRKKFLKNFRNYYYSLYFKHKLKSKNISHIHAHFAFIAVDIAQILSKLLNVNFSFTAHAQDIYTNEKKIKQIAREAFFIITCTKFNKDYINKITESKFEEKIFSNYHGIDISKWKFQKTKERFKNSTVRILTIARLVEKKGLDYLLQAILLLVEQGIKVKCTIIGEGPLQNHLIDFVNQNSLQSTVQFLRFMKQKELEKHFFDADIFVLPCIKAQNGDMDGLPNVILEAMASGVPVISTYISAIPEAIEHRETGLLVSDKNEKALANAILELRNDKLLYEKIVVNGREKILCKFTIKSNITSLEEIFKKAIPVEMTQV